MAHHDDGLFGRHFHHWKRPVLREALLFASHHIRKRMGLGQGPPQRPRRSRCVVLSLGPDLHEDVLARQQDVHFGAAGKLGLGVRLEGSHAT